MSPNRSVHSNILSALALIPAIAGIMPAEAAAPTTLPELTCRLSMPTTLGRKEPAVAVLALRNTGKLPLAVLKRNTPLEGWFADSLIVTRDSQPVAYSGAMAKRMPPTVEEYLLLKPGARRRARIMLQRGYDVSLPGKYEVRWKGEFMDVQTGKSPVNPALAQPQALACNALIFTRSQ